MGCDKHSDGLTCVDLWRMFGDDYKITTDPAYEPTGINTSKLDPWYFTIPCKYGVIWPYGRQQLAICIDYHDQIANRVRALPGVWVLLDGDREKTFVFDVQMFKQVAAIVKPRKRKKLSSEQKNACSDRLRGHRFPG